MMTLPLLPFSKGYFEGVVSRKTVGHYDPDNSYCRTLVLRRFENELKPRNGSFHYMTVTGLLSPPYTLQTS